MMSLNTRSCVSVCAPGHRDRGSLRFLEWFYFRGNKKVTRIMKTNVQKRFWPGLTVSPEGTSVKHGHTRGWIGQIRSHPKGETVRHGHTRGYNGQIRPPPGWIGSNGKFLVHRVSVSAPHRSRNGPGGSTGHYVPVKMGPPRSDFDIIQVFLDPHRRRNTCPCGSSCEYNLN